MLADWLALRGRWAGPIFVPINKAGRLGATALTAEGVYGMIRTRALQAGVPHISPHDFRRTLAGDLMDRGVDIATVADVLGHESLDTTRRYDRRGDRRKAEAAGRRLVPYRQWVGAEALPSGERR